MNLLKDKRTAWILGTATIITAVGGAYAFWRSNIYRPKVKIASADYNKGVAALVINGKQKTLLDNQTLSAGGGWGVRFASDDEMPSRIELVKNDLVYNVIHNA